MVEIKKTKRTKQYELYREGKLIQKFCRTCQVFKAPEEFYRKTEGYLRPDCKECHRKAQNLYNKKMRDRRVVQNQNSRARKLGLHDNYSIEEFEELKMFSEGKCMFSGREVETLELDHVCAMSKMWLGNFKGNLILLAPEVNQAKRDMSLFDFLESDRSKGLIDKKQLRKTMEYLAEANCLSLPEYVQFLKDTEELAKRSKEYWR